MTERLISLVKIGIELGPLIETHAALTCTVRSHTLVFNISYTHFLMVSVYVIFGNR